MQLRWHYTPNIPYAIHQVIRGKIASLQELKTIYGVKDLYELTEILLIDQYNEVLLCNHSSRQN
ncbi:hypothetical protein COMNV_00839 [Commensalibacter sp. Nvir]|uniref:hypothetical protein n=1 Tax=Commensalibacter sp. Nvir TaxID=3069817 RepID=UPI002D35FCD3|nr:hypothetical protein COMNV_00839 [Commensalibacter sp. Nvir]